MILGLVSAMGAVSSAAQAATLPSVVTGPPSQVAVTGATLSGDVDPGGATTTYDFEYGDDHSGYGLDTAVASAGAGTHEVGVASRVDGLTPGTTYHYRLVARSSVGPSYGSDSTFRTPAYAPTILKSSFDEVADSSADVVVEIDGNGLASTWYVRYGTSPALGLAGALRLTPLKAPDVAGRFR